MASDDDGGRASEQTAEVGAPMRAAGPDSLQFGVSLPSDNPEVVPPVMTVDDDDVVIDITESDGRPMVRHFRRGLTDRRPPRPRQTRVDVTAMVVLVGAVAWLARTNIGPVLPLGAAVLAGAFVSRRNLTGHERRSAVLAAAAIAAVGDYVVWRARVINWSQPWLSLPLYAAEVFAGLHIVGFHYTLWPREPVPLVEDEDPTRRPVFILIPTVDEGLGVLEPTLRGALAARRRYRDRHPHARVEIVVCNDGGVAGAPCASQVEDLCSGLGVRCITRAIGGGAKAGNLENARRLVGATGDALLVIFDADQVAEPDFLLDTVPSFRDASVAWVQTGQYYRNLDNPIARWANDQQAIFYRVLCPGKAAGNAAFICGTNVVLRAEALDEIGGFPQTSVTEDFAASIVLHQRWRSIFVPGVLATGLGPLELKSYLGQQRRWARGTLGVFRRHWRDIFLPGRNRRLHPEQRVQYALAGTHYLCGLRDLVYVVVPVIFLFTGIPAVRGANLSQFLSYFVPYWILTQVAFFHAAKGRSSFRGIVIGFGSFPVLAVAAVTGFLKGGGTFTVTAKRRVGGGTLRYLGVHLVCLVACVGAVIAAAVRGGGPATLISALWAGYTMVLLLAFVGLAVADARVARRPTAVTAPPADTKGARSGRRRVTTIGLAATVTVAVGVAVVTLVPSPSGDRSLASAAGTVVPATGLDFTTDLVATGAGPVEQGLGFHVGLVGRTQEISDHFDRAWADAVARSGGRPWVQLLFSAPGQPTTLASLPAVANGVHDTELRRWAAEIRAWGGPVDLTILEHVDRDWVVTSAVANGGVPQDTGRAWTHVRSIFGRAHAGNVTWIWAPADPGADGVYAPPAGTYDAVLLSLIEYPATTWPDPAAVIGRVEQQHPRIPLLVETSVAGPEVQRTAWLERLGTAIGDVGGVSSLVYHEGGPAPVATAAQRAAWSLNGDPAMTTAFADAVRHAGLDHP